MKERPILMASPMVRATRAGTKTQTRRAVRPTTGAHDIETVISTPDSLAAFIRHRCPYGQPGDRLYVRETFSGLHEYDERKWPPRAWFPKDPIWYWADGNPAAGDWTKPKPGIHMPRWASRILLEITGVRVERLQAISEADAIAEGIFELVPPANRAEGLTPGALALAATMAVDGMPRASRRTFLGGALAAALGFAASPSRPWEVQPARWTKAPSPQQVYALLWESINGPGSWAANPWVWVVEFKRAP